MKFLLLLVVLVFCFGSGAATYYIDSANGADGNNGLGPDASAGTNKPWKTIAKYMRTNGVSGDTAYLAPGVYRESVTVNITSPTATTKLIGDPHNVQGFKTSGGVLVTPAICRWTVMTNDSTASPNTSALLLNGSDYWWFENIYFNEAGAGLLPITGTTTTSTNLVFTNCVVSSMTGSAVGMSITAAFGVPLNLKILNCKIISVGNTGILITHQSGTGSDWNLNVRIENCEIMALAPISITKSGASANVGGGILVTNCILYTSGGNAFSATATSTNNFTNYVTGCIVLSAATGFNGGDVSQTTEDYNIVNAVTARANTNTGANSKTAVNPMIDFDASRLFGFGPRPFFSPLPSSPLLGAGLAAEAVDLFNTTRPSPPAIGAYELYKNVETSHSFAQ